MSVENADEGEHYIVHEGDCLQVMRRMPDCSVDSIVTDPPYGLSFMCAKWDVDVPPVEVWAECLRVLKPGGHLLAFAGTRTQHRMATRIEDAGFEIRDMICWHYGSGFPKSHNIGKGIDKAAGATREVVGINPRAAQQTAKADATRLGAFAGTSADLTAPATDAAREWQGWGTALKPSTEPISLARKPLCGTIAANVQTWGTGGLNIDGCRVGSEVLPEQTAGQVVIGAFERGVMITPERVGRWPANLIHDGECEFGEWQRYFYCAKASKADRDDGLAALPLREPVSLSGSASGELNSNGKAPQGRNIHPTVKPTELMRYLCRLVTPPGGLVLDPFAGSGSTGRGAVLEGFRFLGIELNPEYAEIARARIDAATRVAADVTPSMFGES